MDCHLVNNIMDFERRNDGNDCDTKIVPGQMVQHNDREVMNNAGGYVYKIDDIKRLKRFLCLGSDGGTYYVGEKELTKENAKCVERLIEDKKGDELLKEIRSFSIEGRTAKQKPIIFALAICCRQETDKKLKTEAYKLLSEICKIPTHVFMFIEFCEKLSRGTGWGRAHKKAIAEWYLQKDPKNLAYLVTKYQNRNGWTHRDVLRLAHPKTQTPELQAVFKYIVKGLEETIARFECSETDNKLNQVIKYLSAVEKVKSLENVDEVLEIAKEYKLVREHIPTGMLNKWQVWGVLLKDMPLTAMMRNLNKMSKVGLLAQGSDGEKIVLDKLSNPEALKAAHIHPFNVLVSLHAYKKGKGQKGSLVWDVNENVVTALDHAFYLSFRNVEPTHQRYCLALDVSGSMSWDGIIGSESITPAIGSAALAMVTLKTETNTQVMGFSHQLVDIDINPDMRLDEVVSTIQKVPMGGTDCALPMVWAKKENKLFDVFVVFTDSDTWAGNVHPDEALRQYRKSSGIWNAKLIVCAMTATEFSIADPDDPGMLDMTGFDSSGPQVMHDFVLGLI